MSKRAHLSIGEVLTLLQGDFPDLTITKIRFLESQGLVAPERTPSGYRKFYDHDIERLRWILKQQREHFLPLKVIKGRLDGAAGVPTIDAADEFPEQAQLTLSANKASEPPPVWMADHAKATATPAPPSAIAPAPVATARSKVDGSATSPSPEPTGAKLPEAMATIDQRAASVTDRAIAVAAGITDDATPLAVAKPVTAPPPAAQRPEAKPAVPAKPAAAPNHQAARPLAATTPPKEQAMPTPKANQPSPDAIRQPLDLGVSGISMSRTELAAASGLTDSQLSSLESFGLITSDDVADDAMYAEEALIVARNAATFFALGIEARHLRAFKVAADREAGLAEQLILPLLKQRNPAARQEAVEVLRRITTGGAAIHQALLHQALRPYLNPSN